MQFRRMTLMAGVLCVAGTLARAQQANAQAPSDAGSVIRTETRLVLVDTVVTDKKGNYVRDLTSKDFHVWEDNKEQPIKSFSFEGDPASGPQLQKHYLVLFFDLSSMQTGDQIQARQAAGKFIDSNAGPERLIAIVNFGGSVHIAQNFTADVERLKQVVSGVKMSAVSSNVQVASAGMPSLGNAEADFGARSVLLGLRSMAKSLASIPGRKTLVLLTAGFPLTEEVRSELTAVIDACNKANVAVYPIDVRGLVAAAGVAWPGSAPSSPSSFPSARLLPVSFSSFGSSFMPQHGAGGGGGGGGATGGGAGGGGGGHGATGGGATGGGGHGTTGGGSTGGNTGGKGNSGGSTGGRGGGSPTTNQSYLQNPYNQPRQIIPPFPDSATTNQQVLYALAAGTGGFVIVNTNDLLGGMQKIGREQDQYYILGYAPTDSPEGSCHTLRVKVERDSTIVRSRSGYCNTRSPDLLAGNPAEKDLESRVAGSAPGNVTASMQVPFFYTSPNTARVDMAMEIAPEKINFEKVKGKFHSTLNILGIAYRPDGTVAARFSDALKLDVENKKEMEAFKERPIHYENQFEVVPGQYNLKVAFSSGGQSFGKLEMPLAIDSYDGKQFSLSAVVLSKEVHRVADMQAGLDAELLEGRKTLVTQGMQLTPSGTNQFKKTDIGAVYVEIYEPLLAGPNPPTVGLQYRVVDRKTGEAKQDTGLISVAPSVRPDDPVIPVGLKLPVGTLTAGSYRAEMKATDSAGRTTALRSAEFDVVE